jgi:hypothetical protein
MADGSVRGLVELIGAALPETHVWDERERAPLDLAARQAADIAEHGVRVQGRGGQRTLNQSLGEAR